jgi:folate-binding protein YgfZ
LTPALLEVVRIEHGIPRWGRELGEETLPPEAGLDATHIDYHKGCYIGQEVISRLKSVGHVNRRLVGFTHAETTPGDSSPLLPPGMRIFAAGDETKQIGEITSSAFSLALAKPVALGYLRREAPLAGLVGRPANAAEPAVPLLAQDLPFT